LDMLRRKLVRTALDFIEEASGYGARCADHPDGCSLDCFELLPGGARLVIELGVLPPRTPDCEGALRAEPPEQGSLRCVGRSAENHPSPLFK